MLAVDMLQLKNTYGGDKMKSSFSKSLWLIAAALLALSFTSVQAGTAKNGYNKQKVVYHINNIHTAKGALRNPLNHTKALDRYREFLPAHP